MKAAQGPSPAATLSRSACCRAAAPALFPLQLLLHCCPCSTAPPRPRILSCCLLPFPLRFLMRIHEFIYMHGSKQKWQRLHRQVAKRAARVAWRGWPAAWLVWRWLSFKRVGGRV